MQFARRLFTALFVALLVLSGVVQIASAKVIVDPGGGGSGGGGSGGGGSGGGGSRPKQCAPYLVSSTSTSVRSITPESQPFFTPTGAWQWVYDYTDVRIRVEGYEDRLIKQAVQKYDPVGRDENDYYIIDFARPTFKNTYQKIEHRSGRFTVSGLTWAPVYSLPLHIENTWSDCVSTWKTDDWTTGGPTAPIREWGVGGFPKYYDFPAADGTCPVEVPGVRPAGAPPFEVLQCEVVVNTFTRIEPGKELPWAFGGKPSRNLFSGTRGRQAVFGIDTLAQGDLTTPPARNQVDEVIVRVPELGIGAKMALYEGNRQKGQWITALVIPWDARIGRYKVEFVVSGLNYWGERREKVVYGWLQVDGGSCAPTDRRCQMQAPGPVSFCGLTEDAMRELGDRWVYHCMDPRLIR